MSDQMRKSVAESCDVDQSKRADHSNEKRPTAAKGADASADAAVNSKGAGRLTQGGGLGGDENEDSDLGNRVDGSR